MSDRHAQQGSRPVADAPVEALLGQVDDLAKRWAMTLIAALPLQRIGDLPLEDLAREAPEICAIAIRALASDAELGRLTGASRLGVLAGARDHGSAVRAVDSLRAVLWESIAQELRDPHPRQIADLADRLAHVCATIAVGVVSAPAAGAPSSFAPASEGFTEGRSRPDTIDEPVRRAQPDSAEGQPPSRVMVFDDLGELRFGVGDASPRAPQEQSPQAERRDRRVPPELLWSDLGEPRRGGAIEVRDLREHQGPAAWVRSIGRRLERYAVDASPFAVLLVDVIELTSEAKACDGQVVQSQALARMEQALAQELAVADTLTCETPGRYWVVTDGAATSSAGELGARLERVVRLSARDEGRFEAAVGIAICPDDGREPAALAAHADVEAFAVRSAKRVGLDRRASQRDPTPPRGGSAA